MPQAPSFLRRPPQGFGLLGAALAAAVLAGCSKAPPTPEPVRAVRTVTVAAAPTGQRHEYAAEVRARTESRLGFRVGGKLLKRGVNLGDSVRPGQLLAQLDPTDLRLGQDAARAALAAAEAALEQNEADIRRHRELRAQGFISGAELERREVALKAARAQADQARAQVGVQANQAAYASLVADVAGVVTAVEAEPGAVLAAGAPVLRLAHDGPRDVVFQVPEDRVEALRALLGRPGAVQLRLWAEASRPMPGTVREVAAAADPATRTFQVKADAGAATLRPGQTASVVIEAGGGPAAVRLPLSAVFEQQGRATVWLVDPQTMTVRPQPIEVGGADGRQVVVAGGLQPGQVVVTAGVHVLGNGQKVSWYREPAPASAPAVTPLGRR